jgi:chemotaxis methyl-accepting protein methylase
MDALTVNVSEFFRNPATFRALSREVFPRVIAQKRAEGRQAIRVWSAGCATGEEPYSLAITLREFLKGSAEEFAVLVFATDVDAGALHVARAGRYGQRSMVRVPRQILQRHFEPCPGGFRVSRAVRRLVQFRQHNLLDPFPFRRVDVAVFRNVLIYMARPLHNTMFDAFYDVNRKPPPEALPAPAPAAPREVHR